MADTYAWTDIRNGGEVEKREAGGRLMNVVMSRNIIKAGTTVSQSDLGVDDAEWQRLHDEGIVRDYPQPEGTDEFTSPTQAFISSIVTETGEVDVDQLLNMGLQNPGVALTPEQVDAATTKANERALAEEAPQATAAKTKSDVPKGA